MSLNLEQISLRAKQNKKTLICEVERKANIRQFKINCDTCNNVRISSFRSFKSCEICYNKTLINEQSFFKEEFINKSLSIHNNKYNYDLVEYINSKTKVKIFCNVCKNSFFQTPNQHLKGNGCINCYHNKLSSNTETFIFKAKQIHGNKFNYDLVEYIKSHLKIKILCNQCNIIIEQRPNDHLKGYGCKNCANNALKLNQEEFILKSQSIHGDKYNYKKVQYLNNHTKVIIKCNSCNICFKQRPNDHLSGRGCFICASNLKKTSLEDFILKSKKIHDNRYNYDSVLYTGSKNKIDIFCLKCNTLFSQKASHHLGGQGCPFCNESRGELYLKKILRENNIAFIPQHKFPGLRNINPLKCDVYVPIVNLVIEVDGEGHREACFGSTPEKRQKNFEDTVRNDGIKDNYFEEHGINICRIAFSESDKDLSFIGEIAMNCYNDLLKVKNLVQLTFDI
jgi:hypothetical protein